jgi:hypothetical protein
MANKTAGNTVYPPRYFAGWVILRPQKGGDALRVSFGNAPLLPLDAGCALIYPGTRDSAFYSAWLHAQKFPTGSVSVIQYAISVYDAGKDRYLVEKFNHKFVDAAGTVMERRGDALMLTAQRDLFRVYRADEVMRGLPRSRTPVVQFIA